MAVVNNPNPKLVMEPTIIAPPDVPLPNVNMAQYGDPLAKIGPPPTDRVRAAVSAPVPAVASARAKEADTVPVKAGESAAAYSVSAAA